MKVESADCQCGRTGGIHFRKIIALPRIGLVLTGLLLAVMIYVFGVRFMARSGCCLRYRYFFLARRRLCYFRGIILRGAGIAVLGKPALALVGLNAVFWGIGTLVLKKCSG